MNKRTARNPCAYDKRFCETKAHGINNENIPSPNKRTHAYRHIRFHENRILFSFSRFLHTIHSFSLYLSVWNSVRKKEQPEEGFIIILFSFWIIRIKDLLHACSHVLLLCKFPSFLVVWLNRLNACMKNPFFTLLPVYLILKYFFVQYLFFLRLILYLCSVCIVNTAKKWEQCLDTTRKCNKMCCVYRDGDDNG